MTKAKLKVTIEKAIYGGAGLAHAPADDAARAGKAVFVPMTLPGEVVEVEIVNEKKQFATARLLQVVTPSADRVAARCQHYGVCGGCDYQHAEYAAQLQMKTTILGETLERAGLKKLQETLPEIEVHAGEPWEYRNRIRLHVTMAEGRPELGYTLAQSNAVVVIRECPIAAPLLVRAALALEAMAYEDLTVLDVLAAASEVELFCNADESLLMVTLIPRENFSGQAMSLEVLRVALMERVPEVQTVAWRGAGGKNSMRYVVDEENYLVPQDAFFQGNRYLLPTLLKAVVSARGRSAGGHVAWDLYAGVGLFARVLAQEFDTVEAVESSAASSAGLKENLAENDGAGGHHVHQREVLSFLMQMAKHGGDRPELVVVDPPRAGLGADVCRLLAKAAPELLVYVSCDPATLARDMAALMQTGYRCDALHMFDMFPQTSHIEAMAVLTKQATRL